MKTLCVSRRQILRAIRATCYALVLAAMTQSVRAQTVTAPFVQTSGGTYTTTTPYSGPGTFFDPNNVYTVTVNGGTTIVNTTAAHGNGTQYNDAGTDISIGGGSFNNNGSISQNLAAAGSHYYSAVALYAYGQQDATLTNTGSITSMTPSSLGAVSAAAVSYDNTDHGDEDGPNSLVTARSGTIVNSGSLYGSASGYAFGVHGETAGTGGFVVQNSATGTISAYSSSNYATGIYAHTLQGTGSTSVSNDGTITVFGETDATGVEMFTSTGNATLNDLTGTGGSIGVTSGSGYATGVYVRTTSGAVEISGPNAITATGTDTTAAGMYVLSTGSGTAGDIIINPTGPISASGYTNANGINAVGTAANISIMTSGAITAFSNGPAGGEGAVTSFGISAVTTTGTVTVNVGANISVTTSDTNFGTGVFAQSSATGTATTVAVTNTGTITVNSASSYGLSAEGVGAVSIINSGSGSISVTGTADHSFNAGIYASSTSGTASVTNNGTITGTTSASYTYLSGIGLAGNSAVVINNGSITLTANSSGSGALGINGRGPTGDVTLTNGATGDVQATANGDAEGTDIEIGGSITITNNGRFSGTSSSNYGSGIDSGSGTGSVTITNHGVATGSGAYNAYGIFAGAEGQDGTTGAVTVTNTGYAHGLSTSSGYVGYGILANGSGDVTVTNTATGTNTFGGMNPSGVVVGEGDGGTGVLIAASGSATLTNTGTITGSANYGTGVGADLGGDNITASNSATGTLTGSSYYGTGYGIRATAGTGTISITNNGLISAVNKIGEENGSTESFYGIFATNGAGSGSMTLANTGTISGYSQGGFAYGVRYYSTGSSSITEMNSVTGLITAVSGTGSSYGLSAETATGTITIGNAGHVSSTASTYATGIYASSGGPITVDNAATGTATGTITGGNSSSEAYGLYVDGGSAPVVVTNEGTLLATADSGTATGLGFTSGGNVSITNSLTGVITGTATGSADAFGIDNASQQDASVIVNNHLIAATADAGGAIGIGDQAADDISITNSATGTVTATSNSSEAGGIFAVTGDPASTIALANSGHVTATTASGEYAVGIVGHGGDGTVTLTNSATGIVNASSGAVAFALDATSDSGSITLTNNGQVAAVSAGNASGAPDVGMFANSNTGTVAIVNSGTTTGTGSAADGILAMSAGPVTIANSGLASAEGVGILPEAEGIYASGGTGGVLVTNTGTVTASGSSQDPATVHGIDVTTSTEAEATIMNGGIVTATTANDGYAFGALDTGFAAAVENTGRITATGNPSAAVTVAGVVLEGFQNAFDNAHGATIVATGPTASTYGVFVPMDGGQNDVFTNAGTITSSGEGLNDLGAGNLTVNNMGGTITAGAGERSILLGSGNNTVNIIGNSKITGLMDGGSTHTDNTIAFSKIVVTRPEDTAFKTVAAEAAVDPTALYTVKLGPDTYDFTDFNFVTGAQLIVSSFGGAVDAGLRGLGERLDMLSNVPAALQPLYQIGATNPEAALNAFTGREFLSAYGTISLGDDAAFNELTDNRAFALRSGTGGFDLSGLQITSGSLIASLGDTAMTLNQLSTERIGGVEMLTDAKSMDTTSSSNRWGAWAAGTVSKQDESTRYDNPGYQATTGSPTIGADYRLTDDLAVGGLLHLWTTGANFGDGSRLGVETAFLGAYGTYSHQNWYANGLVGAGYSNFDNHRDTIGGTPALSSPTGNKVIANFSGGYDFVTGPWRISPIVGVQYDHIGVGSYTEHGGGVYDLSVADESIDSLRSKVGVHVMRNFTCMGATITPTAEASWYHEFLNGTRGVTESADNINALGEFVVDTVKPDEDFAMAGVGVSITPTKNGHVTVFTNYNAQAGETYVSHTVSGGVRIGF
jgi:uncharacterized protein YhjY with autotransporter beta-barrel domain